MKSASLKIALSIVLAVLSASLAFGQIWSENFNSFPDGTTQDPGNWTSYATDCDDGPAFNTGAGISQWGVWGGQFTINDIEGAPCCNGGIDGGGNDNAWTTDPIDIEGYCNVVISLDVSSMGNMECDSPGVPVFGCQGTTPPDNSHDQVLIEYNLDGSGFTLLGYQCGGGTTSWTSAPLNGSTLQIRVYAANKSNSEFYYFDNVAVNGTSANMPTFNPIGPLCESDPPFGLPNVSLEGITGTWDVGSAFNPNGMGGTTTTITFTPAAGLCASPTTMDITVNEETPPSPPAIGPFCQTDPLVPLPTNIGGITGNWSGAGVTNNTFDPGANTGVIFITFTPDPGQCATTAQTAITVNASVVPTLGSAIICETDPPFDLVPLQGPMFPTGTWTGPGVSGTTFNPSGQSGPVVLTFTSDQPCTQPATTTITVNTVGMPSLGTTVLCQNSGAFDLTALIDPNYPNGTWSGPGVNGNTFNPAGQSGSVVLTFVPAGFCVTSGTTTITVEIPSTPNLGTISICQNQGPFDLTILQDPQFPNGTWSGTGVTNSPIFDPTGLVGGVSVTFTPTGCAFANTTVVNVEAPGTPNLGTATLCEDDTPLDLSVLEDPFFPNGNWSGPGVAGNFFNPAGQNGPVVLTFVPIGNCITSETTTVTVEQLGMPMLGTATICQNSGLFNLVTLNDPAYPAGTWSGPGVSGNNFNPSGQSGPVSLTFTPTADCAMQGVTAINVTVPTAPSLATASICESGNSLDLTTLQDPAFPTGTWSGPGVSGSTFDPNGQNGTVNLTFTPDTDCSLPAQTTVDINEPPSFTNLNDNCDPGSQTYTISFDIEGGTAPYTVNGVTVAGSSFTSTTIPSGTAYSFDLDDANACGPVTISGTVNCSCATDAGDMNFNGSPLLICHDEEIPINFSGGEILDPDDLLIFVIHDLPGTTLGNILATIAAPATSFPNPGLTLGETYYVSAVAGSDDGSGNIDLNDPCLSVTQGVPFEIYEPQINLIAPAFICANECFDLEVEFPNGITPTNFEYGIEGLSAGNNETVTEIGYGSNTYVDNICTEDFGQNLDQLQVTFFSLLDGNSCAAINLPEVFIDVLPTAATSITPTLCPGESIVANGVQYDEANPIGQEVIAGAAFNGCDSIIDIALSYFPADTNFIQQTLCTGSSLIINGNTYDAANPSGVEILPSANVNGCDSTIVVDLTFNSQVTFNLEPTLCQGDSVVVNGTVYNSANPNGSETFPMGSFLGCDSTVIVALDFFPLASSNFNPELCTGGSITINGTVYDESNPSGQEILPGASINGCDSTLNIGLVFNSEVFENFTPTLCPGQIVFINGTTYDEDNPNGQETFPMGSFLGCDSTVIIGLTYHPIDTHFLSPTLCPGGSITVNGTVYDELNPSGIETLAGANVNGCDSIVSVNLNFSNSIEFNLDSTLCASESILVNGNVYDESSPSGSEVFPMGSYLGCDSTVNIDLSFYAVDTNFIAQTLCTGSSLTINGTVYDEANPMGIELLSGASSNGCDSIVSIDLEFDAVVFGNLDSTLCDGGSILVNGTLYDQSNPSGMENFPGGSYLGCDSTVIVDLNFALPVTGTFVQTLCTGSTVNINGTLYGEANPTGTEVFVGGSYTGCDSTLTISLFFEDEVEEDLDPTLCPGESITVMGILFDEDNPFGEVTFENGSFFGCDSTVIVDLDFFDPIESDFSQTLCTGGSVTINGNVYDENNPFGTEILVNAAQNGCDSTVNISLFFDDEVTENIDSILCPGGQILVNGVLFDETNPTGTETIVGGSYLGCDSTVNVNLSFFPEAFLEIDSILAFGQTLEVNGTTYSQTNPVGTEVIIAGSWTGCDSTILVSLTFEGSFTLNVTTNTPTCPLDSDGSIFIDTIIGGQLPYVVSLNGGPDMEVFLFPVLFENLSAGFYTLVIRDATGQIVTENLLVDNAPTPLLDLGPDREINLGQSITLSADTDFNPLTYQWDPPTYLDCTDCPDPLSTPSDDITYTLTTLTPEGCLASDDITLTLIKERKVYGPNAFSPNNDAINDEFTLFAGPQVARINRLLIFDRWGANVFELYNFEPNNLSLGWDGTHNGEKLDPAVFVWFAEVEFLDGAIEFFEGGVTLIR